MTIILCAGIYAMAGLVVLAILAILEESTDLSDAFWWSILWPYTVLLTLMLLGCMVMDRLKTKI